MFLVCRRRHQDADVATDDLRLGIAEQLLGPAVERLDVTLGVDDDDAVDRRVEDGVEPFGARRCRRSCSRWCASSRDVQAVIEPGDDQTSRDEDTPSDNWSPTSPDGKPVGRQQEIHRREQASRPSPAHRVPDPPYQAATMITG